MWCGTNLTSQTHSEVKQCVFLISYIIIHFIIENKFKGVLVRCDKSEKTKKNVKRKLIYL